ncbi:capsid cement protein [Azospirillum sp. 11R-A]|uniref:capsid cement protein n=1 Tax=Azospirillum sp. 11R-A TaxID=3111634 RepID=UPI003C21AF0C
MSQALSLMSLSWRATASVAACRCVGFDGAQIGVKGAKVAGVSDYSAAEGEMFAATCVGTAMVEAGAAFNPGDSLIADAQGRAIPATGPLAVKAGATAVTSTAANGAAVLQGADLPEFVFADALEAATGPGQRVEVLFRR